MKLRSLLAAIPLALAVTTSGALAAGPHPSVKITRARVAGQCITVNVQVAHFKLVKPQYANIKPLKGNQGHIHYVLNGVKNFLPTRDAAIALSHTWCGAKQGVKKGMNSIEVYLATALHKPFPGAQPALKAVMVK